MTELRHGDLVLRQPREEDIPAIVAGCSDPDVPRYIPLVPTPYSENDARAFLADAETRWREGHERTFAILSLEGEFLGMVTVRLREGGMVGYWIVAGARGRGVATTATQAVVDWATREYGIGRLQLMTHPENVASQRVAEKAGFHRIGTTPHDPPFRDGTDSAFLFERRA